MIIEASMKVTPKNANVRQQSLIPFLLLCLFISTCFTFFFLFLFFSFSISLFFFLFFLFLFFFFFFPLFFFFFFFSLFFFSFFFFFNSWHNFKATPTLVLKSFPKQFQSSFIFNGKVNSWFSTLACNELVEQELVKISSRGSTKDIMQGWLFG